MATALALAQGTVLVNTYGWFLLVAGDYQQALEVYGKGLNLMPVGRARLPNLRGQILALIRLGRIEEAKSLLVEAWDLDGSVNPGAYISALVRTGDRERAERILSDLQNENKPIPSDGYLALGDIDSTFKAIEAEIEDHNGGMIDSIRTAEWWDEIRDDPRFDDMLELLDSKETHTEQYLNDLEIQGK
jgi:tetratricopeptide (TPR) repeat protein